MSVTVVTPPEDPVVSLDEAKAHLRVDHNDSDAYIPTLVAAATALLDGPSGWLGRALGLQTLELRQDHFSPCDRYPYSSMSIVLPYPPIVSVTSVKYLDTYEVLQTVANTDYVLRSDGRLALAVDKYWPAIGKGAEPVRIVYKAGYATVPAPIKAAVLLMVGDLYEFRETVAVGASVAPIVMSTTVEALLGPYRVY